jgi:hypothetical protein
MDENTFRANNPIYIDDLPPEPEICGACDNEEATDYWLTSIGRIYLCATCLDWHLANDTNFLIEKL